MWLFVVPVLTLPQWWTMYLPYSFFFLVKIFYHNNKNWYPESGVTGVIKLTMWLLSLWTIFVGRMCKCFVNWSRKATEDWRQRLMDHLVEAWKMRQVRNAGSWGLVCGVLERTYGSVTNKIGGFILSLTKNLSVDQPGAEEACVIGKESSITKVKPLVLRWDNRKVSSQGQSVPRGWATSSQFSHHPSSASFEGVEDAGLRRLWRAAEAWHPVTGLGFLWRGPERTLHTTVRMRL